MKYQVLARKYRPKTFASMMGQEHVLKALSNALDSGRLHHAYLFTGTRGVGKTTVARVLAKSLNCEQGVSASPCGVCDTCQEIDQGRFIDLIEVDAASKTKVEDTRELLDNVQYAPTRGRFKIYLIDEVHMLSGHSFNALLKTLEEPPPHAKFLLATTDPQKLPVTILSRCLQFNLKSLTIEQIEQQLEFVLNAEKISFDKTVLKPLAIAADGSMRDGLSLLDQAIAYSNGLPNLADIEAMLGSVQTSRIFALLEALANADGRQLIEQTRVLTRQGIDVTTLLAELINTLQRVALCQMVPDIIDDSLGDQIGIEKTAQLISPEDIQLYYQIALNGRKDLPYSPQPQSGFEMILLRMLAFKPDSLPEKKIPLKPNTQSAPVKTHKVEAKAPIDDYELPPIDTYNQTNHEPLSAVQDYSIKEPLVSKKSPKIKENLSSNTKPSAQIVPLFNKHPPSDKKETTPLNNIEKCSDLADYWHDIIEHSELMGLEQQLAKHCALLNKTEHNNELLLELSLQSVHKHLLNDKIKPRLIDALQKITQQNIKININECQSHSEKALDTPRMREIHDAKVLQEQAEASIINDSKVQMMVNGFTAKVIIESIKPI
ncbi:MAG: DNA polymerase III subunit gamma/tau [Gammaproteobacteria bacterium]|nr:DNA polymerase III subunit gamma/tau [Gammaproteobacteria bacterium]